MLLLVLFAFLAGMVTLASPCILPVLPIILASSTGGGKWRPLGVVTGFVVSFSFFALFLSSLVQQLHVPADALRWVAILVIIALGFTLWWPAAQLWWEKITQRLSQMLPAAVARASQTDGWWGGIITGTSLGLVWTPCVGPILAAVISLSLVGTITTVTVAIIFAYAVGTAVPMLVIMMSGRAGLQRVPWLVAHTTQIQRGFGMVVMALGVAMALNLDRQFQIWLLAKFPNYGTGLTQLETIPAVQKALETVRAPQKSATTDPSQFETAPDFTGGTHWLNSEPLSLTGNLQGKVVLVDFWTYSCINCLRTLPYLKHWYETYKDQGFVIVGVHSPEFAFEKVTSNVQQAVKDLGITYPVVQDNNFAIWGAYQNQYWPAHYLIDAQGKIRHTHFGEGAYDETEAAIQALLTEAGRPMTETTPSFSAEPGPSGRLSPETYLGSKRAEFFNPTGGLDNGEQHFQLRTNPSINSFSLGGTWTVGEEEISAGQGATLSYRFQAQHVYLVLNPGTAQSPAQVKVWLDDQLVTTETAGEDVKNGLVTIDKNRLYELIHLPKNGEHVLRLEFLTPGVQAFAFTFG